MNARDADARERQLPSTDVVGELAQEGAHVAVAHSGIIERRRGAMGWQYHLTPSGQSCFQSLSRWGPKTAGSGLMQEAQVVRHERLLAAGDPPGIEALWQRIHDRVLQAIPSSLSRTCSRRS